MVTTKTFLISIGLLAPMLSVTACEMKNPVKSTHPAAEPDRNSQAMQPEGGSGTVRDRLPANGAAATGGGVTSSNTSAASGGVDHPDAGQGTPPGVEVPMSAQPQVPADSSTGRTALAQEDAR